DRVRLRSDREEQERDRPRGADDDRRPDAEAAREAVGAQGADELADARDGEDQPDHTGTEAEGANRVDEVDREDDVPEEIERRRAGRDPAQISVAEDPAQALLHFLLHPRPGLAFGARLWRPLLRADPEEKDRGEEEADRVDEHRPRRSDRLDEDAGEAGGGELGGGAADLQLRVAFDELIARDERGEIRLVGDVEEDRQDPDDEADDVELPDREDVEPV